MKKSDKIYTTTQVAKICGVSPKVVQDWIDRGTLSGFRIPSSAKHRHRRVTQDQLIVFMRRHNMTPLTDIGGITAALTIVK